MQNTTRDQQSAVDFEGNARLHLSIPVSDIQRSISFYSTLFGQGPSKVRPGYAKFEPATPSVNLSMYETQGTAKHHPGHFGVQVKSSSKVVAEKSRIEGLGIQVRTEESINCCYAIQDKFWISDPDGNEWEIFVVLDNDAPAEQATTAMAACCSTGHCGG